MRRSAAISVLVIALFLAPAPGGQEDQRPRPPVRNDRGLLKVSPEYFDLAANTGGDFYFWAPGEFASARLRVPVHHEDVLLAYGTARAKTSFDIPVESGVQEITLFAGMQRKDLAVLVRPDGVVTHDRDPGVDLQFFQNMLIATLKSPPPGVWRLELDGEGLFAVTAHVKASNEGPQLIRFRFVEPGGRPGHEGMFPITRSVRAGESLDCEVSLSGSIKEAELAFVARDGSLLGTTPIVRAGPNEYAGRCTVPKRPFRAIIRGIDANGARVQRVESGLRTPE